MKSEKEELAALMKEMEGAWNDLKTTFEKGVEGIKKELENTTLPQPKHLTFVEKEENIQLKDIVVECGKHKNEKYKAIAVQRSSHKGKCLLSIVFLGENDEPFMDFEKDIFINILGTGMSKDLEVIFEEKELVILK